MKKCCLFFLLLFCIVACGTDKASDNLDQQDTSDSNTTPNDTTTGTVTTQSTDTVADTSDTTTNTTDTASDTVANGTDTATQSTDTATDTADTATTSDSWAGDYIAIYLNHTYPDNSGFATATINENGTIAALRVSEAGEGTGSIADNGTSSITFGSGTVAGHTATWQGTFKKTANGILGTGTWTSTIGSEGTWQSWRVDAHGIISDEEIVTACEHLAACMGETKEECQKIYHCQSMQITAVGGKCAPYYQQLGEDMQNISSCPSWIDGTPPNWIENDCQDASPCYREAMRSLAGL